MSGKNASSGSTGKEPLRWPYKKSWSDEQCKQAEVEFHKKALARQLKPDWSGYAWTAAQVYFDMKEETFWEEDTISLREVKRSPFGAVKKVVVMIVELKNLAVEGYSFTCRDPSGDIYGIISRDLVEKEGDGHNAHVGCVMMLKNVPYSGKDGWGYFMIHSENVVAIIPSLKPP